ncbi:hypothetical protein GCM10009635_14660 [Actinocatenispora thailandica]
MGLADGLPVGDGEPVVGPVDEPDPDPRLAECCLVPAAWCEPGSGAAGLHAHTASTTTSATPASTMTRRRQ